MKMTLSILCLCLAYWTSAAGDGRRHSPYIVHTFVELEHINRLPSSTDTVYYQLDNDIKLAGTETIGSYTVLQIQSARTVVIDGNNHTFAACITGTSNQGITQTNASDYTMIANEGTLIISNLTIHGGKRSAILNKGKLLITDSRISYSGSNSYAGGGLINGSEAVLINSKITRNVASYGGGFLNSGTLVMDGCVISENRNIGKGASGGGGGENQGKLYANNCIFSNNQSTEIGGAINNYGGTLYLVNSSITGNISNGDSATYGGGIGNNSSNNLHLINCLLANNYAYDDNHFKESDLGYYYYPEGQQSVYENCLYGSFVSGSGEVTLRGNNYPLTASDEVFLKSETAVIYDADGNVATTLTGLTRPSLIEGYTCLSSNSPAKNTGIPTYFDYSDPGNVIIAYQEGNTVKVITSGSEADEKAIVTEYVNGASRLQTNSIGAIDATTLLYYTVKVLPTQDGRVEGGSIFGDYYRQNSTVELKAIANDSYQFVGFYSEDERISTQSPFSFVLDRDTTIRAVFLNSTDFTVSLQLNGGSLSQSPNITPYSYGSETELPQPEKGNCTFLGWTATNATDDHQYITHITSTDYGDKTFHAQWEISHTWDNTLQLPNTERVYDGRNQSVSLAGAPNLPDGYTLNTIWYKDGIKLNTTNNATTLAVKNVRDSGIYTLLLFGTKGTDRTSTLELSCLVSITPKQLALENFSAEEKTYDGTDAANVTDWGSLAGVIGSETVNIRRMGDQVRFACADAGIRVIITDIPLALTGADAGNYVLDILSLTGNISPKCITDSDISISSVADQTYNGNSHTPSVTLHFGSQTLTAGTDFAVSYANNTHTGIATATISGTGNFSKSRNITFRILKSGQSIYFSLPSEISIGTTHELSAYTTSGLPAYFQSSDTTIAKVEGSMLIPQKTGTVMITVSQEGDADHHAAASETRTLLVRSNPTGTVPDPEHSRGSIRITSGKARANTNIIVETDVDESLLSGAMLHIYSFTGKLSQSAAATGETMRINLNSSSGMHIFQIVGKNGLDLRQKIFIHQ